MITRKEKQIRHARQLMFAFDIQGAPLDLCRALHRWEKKAIKNNTALHSGRISPEIWQCEAERIRSQVCKWFPENIRKHILVLSFVTRSLSLDMEFSLNYPELAAIDGSTHVWLAPEF